MAGDKPLKIPGAHSDPFVIDWNGDGALDILSGSSDGGVRCRSDNGSKRWRLASPRNTKRPRIRRTARTSHRVNKRAQPPTEIGTIPRMSSRPGYAGVIVTKSS